MNEAFFHTAIFYIPAAILTAAVMVLLLQITFWRNRLGTQLVTTLSLAAALLVQVALLSQPGFQTTLLLFDSLSSLVSVLVIFAGLMISLLLYSWLETIADDQEEYYLLLLLSVLGALIVTASIHFASFFTGLELMGLSLLAMVAYEEKSHKALEAGVKYLVLSSTASAFMLMGMGVLFLYTGTLSIPEVQEKMGQMLSIQQGNTQTLIEEFAIFLLLVGIAFKLSLVPAHLWAADVVEGSPLPTNALLASISKASVFVVVLRLFHDSSFHGQTAVMEVLLAVAAASILIGNLLGLLQRNFLRLMAFSSIAHFGYLLVVILALADNPGLVSAKAPSLITNAAVIYLLSYVVAITGVFGMLMILPRVSAISDLKGLLWKRPAVGVVLILMLLSLAGIPLTLGFIGKFFLTVIAVFHQLWWLLAALVTGSVIGLFYYLRVVLVICERGSETGTSDPLPALGFNQRLAMIVFAVIVLGVGILPNGITEFFRSLL